MRETASSDHASRVINLITIGLLAAGGGLVLRVSDAPILLDSMTAPWWAFALAFVAAEFLSVDVPVRGEYHTVSFSEAVLVVAAALVAPGWLLVGRVGGGAAALVAKGVRGQKLAFNTAMFVLEVGVVAWAVHTVVLTPGSAWFWALLVAGGTLAGLLGAVAVTAVLATLASDSLRESLARSVPGLTLVALCSASFGGIAGVLAERSPLLLALLVPVVALAASSTNATTATIQQSREVDAVHRYSVLVSNHLRSDEVVAATIDVCRDLLDVDEVVVAATAGGGLPIGCHRRQADGQVTIDGEVQAEMLVDASTAGTVELAGFAGAHAAIAAPVRLNGRTGACLVAISRSPRRPLTDEDRTVLTGLAGQASIALSNAALVDRMAHDAHHDALTGLRNRSWFSDEVDARIDAGARGALLVIDLDRFKDVNDTLGHPTGDRVIAVIARRLDRILPDGGLLARMGGDEFALFVPTTDHDAIEATAQSLSNAIDQPIGIDDFTVQVGSSIGISRAPEDGTDSTELLAHADIAMYVAKRSGSDRAFYELGDDNHSPRRLSLQVDLRRAIDDGALDVWYQPKVSTDDGSLLGLEALARWDHPDHGWIPPSEFVAIAEQSGLIGRMTEAIMLRVLGDVRDWVAAGSAPPVSVNLSARNLLDDTLPVRVLELFSWSGVAPSLMTFEVTETAVMVDRQRVVENLSRFREIGCGVAIDDFGTGYASMSYLRDLPVTELKIDRTFVANLDIDTHNDAIVRSTITLGHDLGLRVVAEGVERPEERAALLRHGCDECQGYLFAAPMPRDELAPLLSDDLQFPIAPTPDHSSV